jgi:WD40 repeat protein
MKAHSEPGHTPLSVSDLKTINHVCLEFDEAWARGERPDIESFLMRVPERLKCELFRHLLEVELEYRCSLKEHSTPEEYCGRFPCFQDSVKRTFETPPVYLSCPTDLISGYQILREIYRGGQGVVYEAVQLATRRVVALKVILEGPFSGIDTARRFEREIGLVRSLLHPNIVSILDSGVSEGHFYLAMPFIRGSPLTEYVQSAELSRKEVLSLFQKVCEVVDHAHQRGVIHRDLKPTNILVDENGTPYLLDFGLAKLEQTEEQISFQTLSVCGQVIGTLAYMSPEQARGDTHEIGVRTDVYALGAILFELLTGRLPFPVENQPVADVLRAIAEQDPPRPSRLSPSIDEEVETILLQALARDAQRRYPTAGLLAEDIARYLAGEPIQAKGDSTWYLLRKALRRHRIPIGVAGAFAVLVIAAAVVVVFFYGKTRVALSDLQITQENLYFERIRMAHEAYQKGDLVDFSNKLDSCPISIRGWEHRHLQYLRQWNERQLLWKGTTAEKPTSMSFSPDGKRVAIGDSMGGLVVLDMDEDMGKCLLSASPLNMQISSLAWLPDGERIALSCFDGTIAVCHVATGEVSRRLVPPSGADETHTIAVSPDGSLIAAGHFDNSIRLWRIESGDLLSEVTIGPRGHLSLVISPDGNTAVIGDGRGRIHVLDLRDNLQEIQPYPIQAHNSGVTSLTISSDGKQIFSGGSDGKVGLWDYETGRMIRFLEGHQAAVKKIAVFDEGKRVISCSSNGTIRFWETATGIEQSYPMIHEGHIWATTISLSPIRILTGGADRAIRLWRVPEEIEPLTAYRYSAWDMGNISLHPTKTLAAFSTFFGGRVDILDYGQGRNHSVLESKLEFFVFCPDGEMLAGQGPEKGTVEIWNLRPPRIISSFKTGLNIQTIDFLPRGRDMLVAGLDLDDPWQGVLKMISLDDGYRPTHERILREEKHLGRNKPEIVVYHRYFSVIDNDRLVWSFGGFKRVKKGVVLDLNGGRIGTLDLEGDTIYTFNVSPNRRWIILNSEERIRMFDARTLEKIRDYPTDIFCYSTSISPDGTRLAGAGVDGQIRLWDIASGRLAWTIDNGESILGGIAFLSGGESLGCYSHNGTVKIWHTIPITEEKPARID